MKSFCILHQKYFHLRGFELLENREENLLAYPQNDFSKFSLNLKKIKPAIIAKSIISIYSKLFHSIIVLYLLISTSKLN